VSARFAAVDLGASSGRVMVGEVGPGILRLTAAARFPNRPVGRDDGLHWDIEALVDHAVDGLAAAHAGGPLTSVGVDSWAVDYGRLRAGRLLGEPFCYRDEHRNEVGPARVAEHVGAEELYRRNGLQHLSFNTLYQLAADDGLEDADRILLVPDLVAAALAGNHVTERTNASTTGLLDVTTREWDTELMVRLGLDVGLFAELVDPGTPLGDLLPHIADRVTGRAGGPIPVVAVGSHDTASAIVGTPLGVMNGADDAAYVSLGTWALAGLELDAPVLTEEARKANFTNEGGVDGTVRFLTNVMGTWLLSETLRSWGETDLGGALREARAYDGDVPVVDVQDPRFLPPSSQHSDMEARIVAWCDEHDVPPPAGRPAVVRCIVLSIAAAIADALEQGAALAGRTMGVVHVVGGGAQNSFLCQAIADRSGLPVLAGPVEATAIGNVLVQARAAGLVGPTLADLRALIGRTHDVVRYERIAG
jgi:rhamnulokinase